MRLIDGLSKAGVPELPSDTGLKPEDRLSGADIQSLILGRELRGRRLLQPASTIEDYRLIPLAGSAVSRTTDSRTVSGERWVQGNFQCETYPIILTRCGAVFRNTAGTRDQQNEYRAFYPHYRLEFSVMN